eukprot:SAG31_NODE_831_length_11669_cov_3.410026_6_plen_96_part_00
MSYRGHYVLTQPTKSCWWSVKKFIHRTICGSTTRSLMGSTLLLALTEATWVSIAHVANTWNARAVVTYERGRRCKWCPIINANLAATRVRTGAGC